MLQNSISTNPEKTFIGFYKAEHACHMQQVAFSIQFVAYYT